MKRGRPAGSAKVPASPHMSRQGSAKNLYLPVSRNNSKNDLSVSPPPSPPLRAASPRGADSNNKVICLYLPNKPKDHGASDEQVQWSNCDRCGKWRKLPGIGAEFARLPDTWYCEFNIWDLAKASCDVPEDALE